MKVPTAVFFTLLMATCSLSGCFGSEEKPEVIQSETVWTFEKDPLTWYHLPGGVDAWGYENMTFEGRNIPHSATGTYYGVGMSTFEPTMGITQTDTIVMSSYGNGPGGSTAIVACDLIGMHESVDYTCENVYNPLLPVVNSNDPYVYVDPWTGRIMKFDMHALLGMTVEWSDNDGGSWTGPSVATQAYSVQDHQTIASSNMPALFHPTTYMFCINGNAPHPLCSASQDGGATWGPETSGAPVTCQSGGLSAHLVGSVDGNFYRGNTGCSGEGYSVFRTTNAGISWTEHPLPTSESGTADTWNAEEAQVEVDSEGNVHAMWMGLDNMPYWSYSIDQGDTWSNASMIAPPINLSGTGFPVVVAGDAGTVAFGYVGEAGGDDESWNAYLTYATDAFNETPLLTTVQLNLDEDPIDTEPDCGYNRCGGLGDFLDIRVDAYGRTWFALSHNLADKGIFATFATGPSLRGDTLSALDTMPIGGMSTL
ncbi:MAG TPA: hypothetical protein QGI72_03160 [Poseidonia sp.]|nr:hypothetical protein [Poseidonia sp.]